MIKLPIQTLVLQLHSCFLCPYYYGVPILCSRYVTFSHTLSSHVLSPLLSWLYEFGSVKGGLLDQVSASGKDLFELFSRCVHFGI
ncbi:hypothetical protein Nepgr_026124 [Nepenthes gracilis]|uniref:Uncharacterized protein n=1 Tax=Nepenthes gracilis TaxID=150966 RepID=A0AAD3T831_NEPGR|nr:hypothetical protein Nepgr_026124 [Nepenthes gracilis]